MATPGKSYTPPKGRATRRRDERRGARRRIPPTLEWILVCLALVALLAIAWWFSLRDGGGGPHTGVGTGPVVVGPAAYADAS